MIFERRASWMIPFLASLLYALFRLPPWLPKQVGMNLDQSWEWAAHEAWRLGLAHGSDLIFTFGPFGFLQTETFVPSTYVLMLSIYVALTAILVASLWWICRGAGWSGWASALWIVAFVESMCLWEVSQSLFFHLSLALLVGHWRQEKQPDNGWIAIEHLLAAGLALCSLVKFTYFTFALPVVIGVALHELAGRRRPPWIIATFGGSWLLSWLAAGQSFTGIWPFLRNSVEIAVGFGQAMGISGPTVEIVLYLAASFLVILFFHAMQRGKDRLWSVISVGCMALLLFLMLKIAFVRHDGHALTAAVLLLPWAMVFVAVAWRPRALKTERLAATCCLAAALLYNTVAVQNHRETGPWWLLADGVLGWPERIAAVGDVLTGADNLRRDHEAAAAGIRAKAPLPHLSGTTDVYPFEGGIALAHGLSYVPRPALHSYSAYTPRLARMDADHLRGPRAPENILFRIRPIDGRFPALDDSLSWPELLTLYDVRGGAARRFLLLRRAPAPRAYTLAPTGQLTGRIGEPVKLPVPESGKPLWATIELRPTWRGRVAATVFKPPAVAMTVGEHSGRMRSYRVLPQLLAAGFLLSPVIASPADVIKLVDPSGYASLDDRRVEAIEISGTGGADIGWAFAREFDIELRTLVIEER